MLLHSIIHLVFGPRESAHIMAVAEQKVGELMLSEVTVEEEEDGNFARTSPDAFVL